MQFLTIFLRYWRFILFALILVVSAYIINKWHYKPLADCRVELQEKNNIINNLNYDLTYCRNKLKAKETELEFCQEEINVYDDDNLSPIKNTIKEGYVIF